MDLTKPEAQNLEVSPNFPPKEQELESYRFTINKGCREISTADPSVHFFKRKDETDDGTIDPEFLAS
jgi:hypothetical protein